MSETIEAESIPETTAVTVRQPEQVVKAPITAAQAKIDAIANLTMHAYERAGTLEITPEETAKLKTDFPDEAFKPGAAGKEHLIYIEHAFLRDRLTDVFGMGKWASVPRNRWAEPFKTAKGVEGSRVYVEAMLVIRGCFVAESVGEMEYYPSNASQNYGDAVEGAESASLRRNCKKFGVGLQAWKKDFCDGWWKRFYAKKKAPTTPPKPAPSSTPAQKPPTAATKLPTDTTRLWMLNELKAFPGAANHDTAVEYFRALAQLMPNEDVTDLPLRFVPATKDELQRLKTCIGDFGNGDQAFLAFKPHNSIDCEPPKWDDVPEKPDAPSKWPEKPVEVPRDKPVPPKAPKVIDRKDPLWWKGVIVPIPHKGESRDAYMKSGPETIGWLYDQRHEQTADGQESRQRLWGFINHYEPKPWTKKDGTQMPPSESDLLFREALSACAEYHEREHPDEKL